MQARLLGFLRRATRRHTPLAAVLIVLACAAFPRSTLAQPAWPSTWTPIGSCAESEPVDTSPSTVDLVGSSGQSAAYIASDTNYAYFRERVSVNPNGGGGFASMSWVVLLQTSGGDPFKYQWLIAVDGGAEQVVLYENDQGTAQNVAFSPIFNDPAETLVYSDTTANLARIVAAGTSIGGQPNYFVDWAFPRSVLTLHGIDPDTALYWYATSANSNNFNKDTLTCSFSPSTTLSLVASPSPSTVSINQTTPVTYTVTVTNTGSTIAHGVTITETDFPAWLTVTGVTSTAGTATSTSSSFNVQIPTIAVGASVTITVSITASPTVAGTFTGTVNGSGVNVPATSTTASIIAVAATNTATVTRTPTVTATATVTNTVTQTATVTLTSTPSNTATASATRTSTHTATATNTAPPSATVTLTFTPSNTATASATATNTHTATATPVDTATSTATVTATNTATLSPTPTATATTTASTTPTRTATNTRTATATATDTPEDTVTSTPSETATVTATATATPIATSTVTHTPASTSTATATVTESPTHTVTETGTATGTPTATQTTTATLTASETRTMTPTPSVTDTASATITPTSTPTPYCGDGTVDPGESCDDGNMVTGDGCDADCTVTAACTLVYPGTERFVGGCGAPTYADIQAAIDAAADGDVITVCAGTYTQSVVVTKQVAIQAATGAMVTVHTAGTAFDVRRSGVRIEGLTIQSDAGAAIIADSICPLAQASCPVPSAGSHLTITNNTILDSPVGIGWQRKVDCVQITDNVMTDNAAHIQLTQLEGAPATQVNIAENTITGGGSSGAAVSLSGLGATIAANTVATSASAGIVLTNVVSTQIIENAIDHNTGDGITIKVGAETTQIHDNNITHNGVGLGNESGAGTLDATLNWWASQTGPRGVFTGIGDRIEDRVAGGTTAFIEYLCAPFPSGFPSELGVCSTETAELKQLVPGRAPDLDPFGRYITFESSGNIDVDPRTTLQNADGSQEVFLLNRRPKKKLTGVCLGGLLACDFDNLPSCQPCNGPKQCPGDPAADPIVLNGECVIVTQLSDGTAPQLSGHPRLSGAGRNTFFSSTNDQLGDNADGSLEVRGFDRKLLEKSLPPLSSKTTDVPPITYDFPAPSLNSKYVYVESNGDPIGENADGNLEIFALKPRSNEWIQITHTLAPVENRRPATVTGRRVVFDSDGNLTGENGDGNRELFIAQVKSSGPTIHQITNTTAPVENRSGSMDANGVLIAFSSNGDFLGTNADGNREIFTWHRRFNTFEQLTNSPSGDNANPVINQTTRFVVFESTADLTNSGATNRRVFQFDRVRGKLTLLSRSRFGTNEKPRIRKRRYVVWESTADLTGKNPNNEWVIYLFDRKKD